MRESVKLKPRAVDSIVAERVAVPVVDDNLFCGFQVLSLRQDPGFETAKKTPI